MKEGIEVHVYDMPVTHGKQGYSISSFAAALSGLGNSDEVLVLVDTGGTGASLLSGLKNCGVPAEAMPKEVPRADGDAAALAALGDIVRALASVLPEDRQRVMAAAQVLMPHPLAKLVAYPPNSRAYVSNFYEQNQQAMEIVKKHHESQERAFGNIPSQQQEQERTLERK